MGLFPGYGVHISKLGPGNGEKTINYGILGPLSDKHIWARPTSSTAYLHRSTKPRLGQDTCVIFASTPRCAEATESIACCFQQLKAWAVKPTSVQMNFWCQHSAHSQTNENRLSRNLFPSSWHCTRPPHQSITSQLEQICPIDPNSFPIIFQTIL